MASPKGMAHDQLGTLLLKKGYINTEQLDSALSEQRRTQQHLGQILVAHGVLQGMDLVRALSQQLHIEYIQIENNLVDPRVLKQVDQSLAEEFEVMPLIQAEDCIVVSTHVRPNEDVFLKELGDRVGYRIEAIHVPVTVDVAAEVKRAYETLHHRIGRDQRIGELLVERNAITLEDLESVLEEQAETGQRFGEIVLDRQLIQTSQFYDLLGEHLGIPYIQFHQIQDALDLNVAKLVPREFAEHNHVMPFSIDDERVHVVVASEPELWLKEQVCHTTNRPQAKVYLATPTDVRRAIREVYEVGKRRPRSIDLDVEVEDVEEIRQFDVSPYSDMYVPKVVNYLLYRAISRDASDIHIEQFENSVLVRMRIDGKMVEIYDVPIDKDNVTRVITKLKLDAHLDIAEHRRPQDGSMRKRFGRDKVVDFRLAFQPTVHGENAVVRLLDRSKPLPALHELGFHDDVLQRYLRMIENPQGMVLFTGPTGSGKTTSLYATLDLLRRRPLKIITAEDPVEYHFERVQQCQVNELLGNTFARYLRGFLRQDPDVILIGEMRDEETADIGVRAAITGHLIFSTVHTNDTISTVGRMLNLGVDADLLASCLMAIVSQRLVRRICPECVDTYEPPEELLGEFFPNGPPAGAVFQRGQGCTMCDRTGFRGRLPIFEFWEIDAETKAAIRRQEDDNVLSDMAFEKGMKCMLEDAVEKVLAGHTTLEELRGAIPYSQIVWYRDRLTR